VAYPKLLWDVLFTAPTRGRVCARRSANSDIIIIIIFIFRKQDNTIYYQTIDRQKQVATVIVTTGRTAAEDGLFSHAHQVAPA